MQIEISKSFIIDDSLHIGPEHVSNGHWLIAKRIIERKSLMACATVESAQAYYKKALDVRAMDARILEAITRDPDRSVCYSESEWLRNNGEHNFVLYRGDDLDSIAWVQEAYARTIVQGGMLWGAPGETTGKLGGVCLAPLWNAPDDNWSAIVMPCREERPDWLK